MLHMWGAPRSSSCAAPTNPLWLPLSQWERGGPALGLGWGVRSRGGAYERGAGRVAGGPAAGGHARAPAPDAARLAAARARRRVHRRAGRASIPPWRYADRAPARP